MVWMICNSDSYVYQEAMLECLWRALRHSEEPEKYLKQAGFSAKELEGYNNVSSTDFRDCLRDWAIVIDTNPKRPLPR